MVVNSRSPSLLHENHRLNDAQVAANSKRQPSRENHLAMAWNSRWSKRLVQMS